MPVPTLSTADAALLGLARMIGETGYRFTTPTPATHARVNARPEAAEARTLADVFGWSRPFRPDLLPASMLHAMRGAGVLDERGPLCRSLVRLSTLHGMPFLHSAYPTVEPDSVFFGPDTYRFADAVAAALLARTTPVHRAADVGCGAGPGGIMVARSRPDSGVLMLDINAAALRLARVNALLNDAPGAEARHSDLLDAAPGPFDLVVANPPYLVDPAERAYRHGGGPLGAGLSLAIVTAAVPALAPGGTLLLYTGAAVVNGTDPFHDTVTKQFYGADVTWDYRELDPDVFGEELESEPYGATDRIAAVLLTVNRNG